YQKLLAEIIGNAIISHHSYLQDFLSPNLTSPYLKRVRDKNLCEYKKSKEMFFDKVMSESEFHSYVQKAIDELINFLKKATPDDLEFQVMFLTKYIFSCLIDADRTSTRKFVENENLNHNELNKIDIQKLFSDYYQKLSNQLDKFKR